MEDEEDVDASNGCLVSTDNEADAEDDEEEEGAGIGAETGNSEGRLGEVGVTAGRMGGDTTEEVDRLTGELGEDATETEGNTVSQ